MTYANRSDLEILSGPDEVEQRERGQGFGAVERALSDATASCDDYLRGRYALPAAPVDASLRRNCAAIARYFLLGDAFTEGARKDYEDALTWLKRVQEGRVLLSAAPAAVAAPLDPARGTMRVATRACEFGALSGFDATLSGVRS